MRIQLRIIIVTLLMSLLLLSPLYAQEVLDSDYIDEKFRTEQLLVGEKFLIREIKEDIIYLLKTRDKKRVEPNVFGDCIHFYLSTEDNGQRVASKEVLPKLHLLFDANFMTNLDHLKIGDNLHLLDESDAFYSNDDDEDKSTIRIFVREEDSEYDSARTYWFYKKNGHWVFVGMTCIG